MKTSPSLYFKQTGSSLQISLTSSPFNIGRRAPTIYEDEPFTVLQTDGLLPTNLIDELSLQHRESSSYCLSRRAQMLTQTSSPFNTGRRAPTFKTTSPSLYFKQTGSSIQLSLTSSPFNTGRRAPIVYEGEPRCSL